MGCPFFDGDIYHLKCRAHIHNKDFGTGSYDAVSDSYLTNLTFGIRKIFQV